MALDHVVGIVVVVGVHLTVLKPVPINSAWSKTYIWTPRSTFYDSRELSYTLKWPRTMLLVYQTSAGSLGMCQGAELHLEVALNPVVGIVVGVDVHLTVLKPVPINS